MLDETLRSLKAKQIDVAILSHPHDDHVKNLIRLIRDFNWTVKLAVLSESSWWGGTVTNRALIACEGERAAGYVTVATASTGAAASGRS